MNIVLLTQNLSSKPWLSYVRDVFCEVTGLQLEIRELSDSPSPDQVEIYYLPESPTHFRGIFIPELTIQETGEEIPLHFNGEISRGSVVQDSTVKIYHQGKHTSLNSDGIERNRENFYFKFDLFKNSFLRLSCAAERHLEREKGAQNSYCPRSLKGDTYLKPIVNYLFEILSLAIKKLCPDLHPAPMKTEEQCPIFPTHDIDAIDRTFWKASKQSIMSLCNIPKALLRKQPNYAAKLLRTALSLPFGRDDFDRIDWWQEMDQKAGLSPLFHVYSRTPLKTLTRRFCSHLYDPDYDLTKNKALAARLRHFVQKGSQMGLHGSFLSHNDVHILAEEKKGIECALGAPVTHIRQHWLRFSFQETWKTQEEVGFLYDTGFGFNDQIGFRSWLAHPHHPWDERNQRAHTIRVIPMVAMDSTLFDYQLLSHSEALENCKNLFQEIQKFNGHANINWHTHGTSRHLNWHLTYKNLPHF